MDYLQCVYKYGLAHSEKQLQKLYKINVLACQLLELSQQSGHIS